MENYGLGDKSNSNESERERLENFTRPICLSKDQEPLYKVVLYIGLQNKQAYWNLLIILLLLLTLPRTKK
jgi:hypothetical protein